MNRTLLQGPKAKTLLDALTRALTNAGHPASIAESGPVSLSRNGETFILVVDGLKLPVQVWQSSTLRRTLRFFTARQREEDLPITAKGVFDLSRVLLLIESHRRYMEDAQRRLAIETALSELETKFGLTRGQLTDEVGFHGVTIDHRQQDDDAPERYLVRFHANIPLPIETAKAVLDLLANDGVLKSKP